jgi:RNA polymerase sigma factor (sigma-70 family)
LENLAELSVVVRRVVAARVRDPHLIEDLTQEALVHVAATDGRLSGDAQQAYAIVTARNLVVDHARSEAVHDRHAHRLVDYTTLDGPEALSLEQEETSALAKALERIDPEERSLLLRHEVEGASVDALAAETQASSGAMAMRLARARAVLRVEFVLAFRRADLPTQRCRSVLISLSAGDRRGQDRLRAADHLLRCPTCAELARPVSARRRGIAVWLIAPLAEGFRRLGRSLRRNHLTQAAAVVVATAAVGFTVVGMRDDPEPLADPPPATSARGPAPAPLANSTTGTAAPSTFDVAAVDPTPSTAPAPAPAAPAIAPAATCPPARPLDELGGEAVAGCPVAPTAVTAIEVPADEGFWAQTSSGAVVWVQLVGEGESAVDVVPGAALVVAGTLRAPDPTDPIAAEPRVAATGYVLDVAFGGIAAG